MWMQSTGVNASSAGVSPSYGQCRVINMYSVADNKVIRLNLKHTQQMKMPYDGPLQKLQQDHYHHDNDEHSDESGDEYGSDSDYSEGDVSGGDDYDDDNDGDGDGNDDDGNDDDDEHTNTVQTYRPPSNNIDVHMTNHLHFAMIANQQHIAAHTQRHIMTHVTAIWSRLTGQSPAQKLD